MAQALEMILRHVPNVSESDFLTYLLLKGMIRVKVGTYTGNKAHGDATAHAITGVGFLPQVLIIYDQTGATHGALVTTGIDAAKTYWMIPASAAGYDSDVVSALGADGFTVKNATGYDFNLSTSTYTYIAFG